MSSSELREKGTAIARIKTIESLVEHQRLQNLKNCTFEPNHDPQKFLETYTPFSHDLEGLKLPILQALINQPFLRETYLHKYEVVEELP